MEVYEYEYGSSNSLHLDTGRELARFAVLYARVSTRKHKKWEGDGVLYCYANLAILKTEDEKDVICRYLLTYHRSTSIKRISDLEEGKEFKMGAWEVQIQERITDKIASDSVDHMRPTIPPASALKRPIAFLPDSLDSSTKAASSEGIESSEQLKEEGVASSKNFKKFKCPLVADSAPTSEAPPFIINEEKVEKEAEEPVLADPHIAMHLRAHQKEGVRFIYSRIHERGGVILADEMGLGKSIQAIVSIMAILKQHKISGVSSARKCLLVVPSSLVNNWKFEFLKWFQARRLPIITVKQVSDITAYSCSFSTYPFLIISYEMALRYIGKLAAVRFDVLICDEGHRLKNINGKVRRALDSLGIQRRLLLTGTPLQNNLEEFFSLLDFVRPTYFGTFADFKVLWSKEDGVLNDMISDCMLKRTAAMHNVHLPTRNDYVFFCSASSLQKTILQAICDCMSGEPLALVGMMRKAANHPAILYQKILELNENARSNYSFLLSSFPKNYGNRSVSLEDSGKLNVFVEMVTCFRRMGECVVVVSNFTKTLDMLSSLCSCLGLDVSRLDGKTPVSNRQAVVERFNSERDPNNIFLLSTKAGGVGLNLVAASRLILFDLDWNPALDHQAMARIWRDGQTKPCHIYRLVTAGTVDEKILHCQIKKTGLTSVINLNEQSSNLSFADKELESIFTVVQTDCETHELLGCTCDGRGLLLNEMEDDSDEFSDDDNSSSSASLVVSESCNAVDEDRMETPHRDLVQGAMEEENDLRVSMAELFRWRHYSSQHEESWRFFKSIAGISDSPLNELVFAFHLSGRL